MFKNSINKIFLTLLVAVTLLLSSCSNWLNVSPKSDMKAEDMFKNESGFRDALIGVYALMANNGLYGSNLSYTFTDVLANYYASPRLAISGGSDHSYKQAANFNYTEVGVQGKINNIWAVGFKAIANINQALEFIDEYKGVFTSPDVYNIYKGEFLALRAMIHFDMLRLYAPSPKMAEPSVITIPYVSVFTNRPQPKISLSEFMGKVIADLTAAKQIMRGSDTYGPESNPTNVNKEQFSNRQYRMNYYATTALLARVYLYAGQNSNALAQAKEIIGEPNDEPKLFKLAGVAAVESDMMFKKEIIFSINVERLAKNIEGTLTDQSLSSSMLTLSQKGKDKLFDGGGTSIEFRTNWFVQNSTGSSYFLAKYNKDVFIPILKISELYLIAAEASTPEIGLAYLNRIRGHRGLSELTTSTTLNTDIYKEFKREFIGEGQLFFYYKRNVFTKIGAEDNIDVKDPNMIYVLPLPTQELESGNIK